jgi:hypothetical protein
MGMLTNEEVKFYYNNLSMKKEYDKILRNSLNPSQIEQIMSFARRLHNEVLYREEGLKLNKNRTFVPFDFPEISGDGPGLDDTFRLTYHKASSELVIKLLKEPEIKIDDKFTTKPKLTISPIIYSKKPEMDEILTKCKNNMKGGEFSKMEYAALYSIIHTRYLNYFKPLTTFVQIQTDFDNFFNIDTHNYKESQVKKTCVKLNNKYGWINRL